MLKTVARLALELVLLYWLAFGLVGMLRQYGLVTMPVQFDGKPDAHLLGNYLLWFFMYPSANLLDALKGTWLADADFVPDFLLTVLFFAFAGLGLARRERRLVALAVLAPIAYSVVQTLKIISLP
jgi:hypothetical protein